MWCSIDTSVFFVLPAKRGCLGAGLEVTNERLGSGARLELLSDFFWRERVCLEKNHSQTFFCFQKREVFHALQDFLGRLVGWGWHDFLLGKSFFFVRMPMPAVDPDSNAPDSNLPMDASWAAIWGLQWEIHRNLSSSRIQQGIPWRIFWKPIYWKLWIVWQTLFFLFSRTLQTYTSSIVHLHISSLLSTFVRRANGTIECFPLWKLSLFMITKHLLRICSSKLCKIGWVVP